MRNRSTFNDVVELYDGFYYVQFVDEANGFYSVYYFKSSKKETEIPWKFAGSLNIINRETRNSLFERGMELIKK